jgi:hypothetical protein
MWKRHKNLTGLLLAASLAALPGSAQVTTYEDQAVVNPWEHGERDILPGNLFTFARVRYQSRSWGFSWDTDYPDSDINFSQRLNELTTIEVNRDEAGRIVHVVLDLTDDRIFEYPFLYMVEVGNLELSDVEATRLREYLLRGGFLLVDDFWEEDEWANWVYELNKVFPDKDAYPLRDIPISHPIFHTVFDLHEVPQVPSINAWLRWRSSSDRPGAIASCRGIHDGSGRLMLVVLHNTDLGDGWEKEAIDYEYFQLFSVQKAYPFGINIVVYAMTH